ncbi:ATP-binding protein [Crossiella cryophila]|uniref:Tetratricopeptide (TPR) repeat protein n=1 Tax=Crossiella cryophila TaxID=43355 RepID=A0A7W7FYL7_9PSEU|nr:tetratricopeptide repeat protein [Crossiella cryophila]MBB4681788.1 tetratricopeptide (TPR) repeat protein [Crossiella cryophila]
MTDTGGVRNQVGGGDLGAVVQAGTIQHLSFAGTGSPQAVPRQLPLAVRGFTGRSEHLAALDALLPDTNQDTGGAVVISAVDGTAGVGKTALAVQWAHRVQHRFPEGTLFANLRGYGPGTPATPEEVLAGFLHALGIPAERIPPGVDAQAGVYRSVLAGRRVLIVLDNANAVAQVRPLLPGSSGCLVLITSRASLTGLVIGESATRLTLDLLTPSESLHLLGEALGADRVKGEPDAVNALIRCCARLPLALRIAAGQAAAHAHTTIAELVAEMADDRSRLDTLSATGDESLAVRAVFDWSYHQLTPEQACLFRRLGLHPGPEISLHVAATTGELGLMEARRLMNALIGAHLIQQVARDRYRFHDLLRAYAADRAEVEDTPADRIRIRRALVQWYAHHAKTAFLARNPAFSEWYPALKIPTSTYPEMKFDGASNASAWMETEVENLISAMHQAVSCNLHQITLLISTSIWSFLHQQGRRATMIELDQISLKVARGMGDSLAEYHALSLLGETLAAVSRFDESFAVYQQCLIMARDSRDSWREAAALLSLGHWFNRQKKYGEALNHLRAALPMSRGAQQGRLEGTIEGNLSTSNAGLGNFRQALLHAERELPLRRQAGDRQGELLALRHMARAHQGLDAHDEAISLCERALEIDHEFVREKAEILETVGQSLCHTGQTGRAIAFWQEALSIFEALGDGEAVELRGRLLELKATLNKGN